MGPLELAAGDVAATERARRMNRSRGDELLELLDQVRGRAGVGGLLFFELAELPKIGAPEATPHPSIVRPEPNAATVFAPATSETSDQRARRAR